MKVAVKLTVLVIFLAIMPKVPVQALGTLTVSQVNVEESNFSSSKSSSNVNLILSSAPSANVTINYSNNGECLLGGSTSGSLTVTAGNSSTSATISAVNDEKTEGEHTCDFSFITASADAQFNGINRSYSATIQDNDGQPTLSIVVTEDSHLKEGNLSYRNVYSIIRGAEEPTSPVTVTIWTDNQCALQKKSGSGYTSQISQTVHEYAVPIIVVANDDDTPEGDHTCHVQHLVSSSDAAYKGNLIDSRYITIEDNDGAPPVVQESGGDQEPTESSSEPVSIEAAAPTDNFVGQASSEPIRLRDPDAVGNLFVIMTFASVVVGTILGWWRYGRSPKIVDKT